MGFRLEKRVYQSQLERAKRSGDPQAIETVEDDWRSRQQDYRSWEWEHRSDRLLRTARRLGLPGPKLECDSSGVPVGEDWEMDAHTQYTYVLSPTGYYKLRDEVRKELLARHQLRIRWKDWIAVAISVVALIISVLSYLK